MGLDMYLTGDKFTPTHDMTWADIHEMADQHRS